MNEATRIGHNRPDMKSITSQLARDYESVENATTALLNDARNLPKTVKNDADLELVAFAIRRMRDHRAEVERLRSAEKESYLTGGRAVDGWFGAIKARLDQASGILSLRAEDYLEDKLARERALRDKEERAAREAAEALARKRKEMEKREASQLKEEVALAQLALDEKIAQQRVAMAELKATEEMEGTKYESGVTASLKQTYVATVTDYNLVPLDKLRPYFSQRDIDRAVRMWASANEYKEQMPGVLIELQSSARIR